MDPIQIRLYEYIVLQKRFFEHARTVDLVLRQRRTALYRESIHDKELCLDAGLELLPSFEMLRSKPIIINDIVVNQNLTIWQQRINVDICNWLQKNDGSQTFRNNHTGIYHDVQVFSTIKMMVIYFIISTVLAHQATLCSWANYRKGVMFDSLIIASLVKHNNSPPSLTFLLQLIMLRV